MKRLFIFTVAIISVTVFIKCTGSENEPFFTGKINYEYSYESETLNADSLKQIKPSKSVFNYDLNNYQSRFIGNDTFSYYYSGLWNKAVSQTNSNSDFECEDYSLPTDSILSFKLYDTAEIIMGYHCRVIEFQTKRFWNRYYVSRDLKISPATYQKHKAYNLSFYGEQTGGGLILKLEHRFKNYTMKGVVTGIEKKDKHFKALDLPEDKFKLICK